MAYQPSVDWLVELFFQSFDAKASIFGRICFRHVFMGFIAVYGRGVGAAGGQGGHGKSASPPRAALRRFGL